MSTSTAVTNQKTPPSFFEFTAPHGEKISPEIMENILAICHLETIPAMAGVNRAWRIATNQDSLWIKLQKRDFPQEVYERYHPEIGPQEPQKAVYQRMHKEKTTLTEKYEAFLEPSIIRDLGGVFNIEYNIPSLQSPMIPSFSPIEEFNNLFRYYTTTDSSGKTLSNYLLDRTSLKYEDFHPTAPIMKQVGSTCVFLFIRVPQSSFNTTHPSILPFEFAKIEDGSTPCRQVGFIPHPQDRETTTYPRNIMDALAIPSVFSPDNDSSIHSFNWWLKLPLEQRIISEETRTRMTEFYTNKLMNAYLNTDTTTNSASPIPNSDDDHSYRGSASPFSDNDDIDFYAEPNE